MCLKKKKKKKDCELLHSRWVKKHCWRPSQEPGLVSVLWQRNNALCLTLQLLFHTSLSLILWINSILIVSAFRAAGFARQPSHARNLSLCNLVFAVDCRHGLWPAGAWNAMHWRCPAPGENPLGPYAAGASSTGSRSHRTVMPRDQLCRMLPRCDAPAGKSVWSRSQSSSDDSFGSNAFWANTSRVSCAGVKDVWQERSTLWLSIHFTFVFLPTWGPEAATMLRGPGVDKARAEERLSASVTKGNLGVVLMVIQTCLVFSLPDCIRCGFSPPWGGTTLLPAGPSGDGSIVSQTASPALLSPFLQNKPKHTVSFGLRFSSPSHLLISPPPLLPWTSLCAIWSLSPARPRQHCLVLLPSRHPQPRQAPGFFLKSLWNLMFLVMSQLLRWWLDCSCFLLSSKTKFPDPGLAFMIFSAVGVFKLIRWDFSLIFETH